MKPMPTLGALAALTILVAACSASGSAGTVPPLEPTPDPSVGLGSPDLTPAPSESIPPSSEPSGSPQASPASPAPTSDDTTIVRAYFYLPGTPGDAGLGSEGLVPVLREVAATKAVATAAMTALLAGPTGSERGAIRSSIPAGTRLLGLSIKDGVATVDLSSEFESYSNIESTYISLSQVVYTLTQFPTVKSVVFAMEGENVSVFGSFGIVFYGPVDRHDYLGLLPTIFIDRPAYDAALGNPAHLTGSAQALFEATFRVTLIDGAGRTILDEMQMADCFCESGAIDITVAYDVPKAQWGTLRVWAGSPKDGSPIHVREYPVWLTPRS
jgi:germination protein M